MRHHGLTRRIRHQSRGTARVVRPRARRWPATTGPRPVVRQALVLAAACLLACAGTGTAGILMEADTVTLPATTDGQTSFVSVPFQQTYSTPPLVFVLPTNDGSDPCDIRVRNVTATGFELTQLEPNNLDGQHGAAMTVDYFAIEPGTAVLPDGTVLHAGTLSTTKTVQHKPPFPNGGGWDTVFLPGGLFGNQPALLAQIQTMNNEVGAPPGDPSTPWLTAAARNVENGSVQLALERAEVNDGSSVSVPEDIGYVAITSAAGTFFDGSNTVLYDAFVSPDNISGWDDNGGGAGVNTPFNQTFTSPPLVIGNLARRDGADGGWLRRGPATTTNVPLTVDEDKFHDSERNHSPEAASILAVSQPFTYDAPAYTQPVGPVAHWPLDDGAGTTATEVVSGYDGTLTNGPTWTADTPPTPFANPFALSFDNADDFVVATGYKGVTGIAERTLSAWIKTPSCGDEAIISWGTNAGGQKWTFRVQDDNGTQGAIRIEVNGGYLVGSSIVGDNQWHHVALVFPSDGTPNVTDCLLYVDGSLEPVSAQQSRAINTNMGADVRIGQDHSNRYFNGLIDDVRIYSRALTAAEIEALAARKTVPLPLSYSQAVMQDGPFAYWRLNETSGTPMQAASPKASKAWSSWSPTWQRASPAPATRA